MLYSDGDVEQLATTEAADELRDTRLETFFANCDSGIPWDSLASNNGATRNRIAGILRLIDMVDQAMGETQ